MWFEFIWHGQASSSCQNGRKILGSKRREEFPEKEFYLFRMTDFAPPT